MTKLLGVALGSVLALGLVLTLKPLLRLKARRLPEQQRQAYLRQIDEIRVTSNLSPVFLALVPLQLVLFFISWSWLGSLTKDTLTGLILAGVLNLGCFVALLVWYLGRSAARQAAQTAADRLPEV